jgi:hypothetical protein
LTVINLGHHAAETPDIDGGFGNFAFDPCLMEEGKNLLGFSHGEDGNKHGTAAFKCLAYSGKEAFLKKSAILTWNSGLGSSCRFHDESVERAGRMLAREHEGLALEIEVTGVEGATILGTDFGHDGTSDMACVVQNKFEF